MPKYKALKDSFLDGQMYGPERKRKFYVADKPLKPVPKGLELVVEETPKRRTAESAAAKKKLTIKPASKEKPASKTSQ
jgi:hypothetical protein